MLEHNEKLYASLGVSGLPHTRAFVRLQLVLYGSAALALEHAGQMAVSGYTKSQRSPVKRRQFSWALPYFS